MKLVKFIESIELQRFKMGMGVVEFAHYLGMHYHTYNSFRKQRRVTQPKAWKVILEFAESKGIDTDDIELN